LQFKQALNSTGGKIVSTRDNNYADGASRDSNLEFYTSTAATDTLKMIIDSDGNVGIGITNPQAPLHVDPATANEIAIAINGTQNYSAGQFHRIAAGDANSLNRLAIGFGYDDPTDWAIRYSSYGRHEFYTGNDWGNAANTEKMVITSTGNVGIGTGSPLGKLQINEYTVAEQGSQNLHGELTVFANSGDESLVLGIKNAEYPNRGWAFNPVTNGVNSDLQIKEHGASGVRMTIQTGGNVGIGVTAPSTKLEVAGNVTINSPAGTSQSSYGLRLRKTNSSDAVQAGGEILASPYPINTNAANLIFKTANTLNNLTQRMVIDGVGNVGIGNTNPQNTLHLGDNANSTAGTLRIDSFVEDQFWKFEPGTNTLNIKDYDGTSLASFDGASNYVLFNGGNVGIGVTAPQSKLQVDGGIQMADDTATPSATKVGTMRYRTGTEYVEATGIQLLLNNNFDTDTVWSKGTGWAISGGTANATASTAYLSQNPFNPSTAIYYQITWTISNYSAGTYRFYMRGNVSADFGTSTYIGNGTFTHVMQAGGGGSAGFLFDARGALTASIDDIILTEVNVEQASYADMCMQTGNVSGSETYEWVNIVRNTY